MKNFLRIAAVAGIALGSLIAAQPSQAQQLVVGGEIVTRLTPRPDINYVPGQVPSQCLPYVFNGRGILFCDPVAGQPPTKYDVTLSLFFGGYKLIGFKTPDDCILRRMPGAPAGMSAMFCQNTHTW